MGLLFACNNLNSGQEMSGAKSGATSENKFLLHPNRANWLFVNAVINGVDSCILVLDNNTVKNDKIIFDMEFAKEKHWITDNGASVRRFMDSTTLSVNIGKIQFVSDPGSNRIMALPKKEGFRYMGILGSGFLHKYILEIDYQHQYFVLDSTIEIDGTQFDSVNLINNGAYWVTPVQFFKDGQLYEYDAVLDLGNETEGFFWGGGVAKPLSNLFKFALAPISKTTATGELVSGVGKALFDSVVISSFWISNVPVTTFVSNGGISGSNLVLFGSGFLERFGKVYIDFRNGILYLPDKLRNR